MPGRSTSRMRFARVMLLVQLVGMAVGAIALVYFLGFGVRPHQVASAFLIAACYLVFTGITTFFMQRVWRAQARLGAANAARQAVGALPTDDAAGFGAPGRRKGLQSLRRAGLPLTLLGAAMLIAFLVLVDHYEGSASALQSNGVHVVGVITSVTGQGEAPADGAVDVQYSYAGQTFDTRVYRDDTSPFYHVGESVTVTLDPSDPQVATVGGSDNEAPAVVGLLIVLLLGGVLGVVVGPAILVARRMDKRKARRAAVQPDHTA